MFDTYAATITIEPGNVADDAYLSQVRQQVANPTGPVHIVGPVGGGKVAGLAQAISESGLPCTHIVASLYTDGDFVGIPLLSADGKTATFVNTFEDRIEDGSVLVIDEYDRRGPGLTDEALLRVANSPKVRQTFVISNA